MNEAALFFVLFAIPALGAPATYQLGCQPHQLSWLAPMGFGSLVAFFPLLFLYANEHGLVLGTLCYCLICTAFLAMAAMLNLHDDDSESDGQNEAPEPPNDPLSINWPSFEREFWKEVQRREKNRDLVASGPVSR